MTESVPGRGATRLIALLAAALLAASLLAAASASAAAAAARSSAPMAASAAAYPADRAGADVPFTEYNAATSPT